MARISDKTIEQFQSLTLLEAAELVKQIQEACGVIVAAPAGDIRIAAWGASAAIEEEQEIDNILVELSSVDNRILQNQVGIDSLKMETREMLTALQSLVD